MGVSEFALSVVSSLVANAISSLGGYKALNYFHRKKIENRVNTAIIEVTEPLIPFLNNEKISIDKQRVLINACREALLPFIEDSRIFFTGALDGQKVYDIIYSNSPLPASVVDEGLESIYSLLLPRIATIVSRIPAALKDWENNAWAENYHRLDHIASEIRLLFEKIDSFQSQDGKQKNSILQMVRKSLAQKVQMKLDLTGLRADKPVTGTMENFFVHPSISTTLEEKEIVVEKSSEAVLKFIKQIV